ncbi:MAG: YceI family protein [Acidimicrobiaceae bacterium]|nr:YceI family protein [Acidimicrobiaceae bacterium]
MAGIAVLLAALGFAVLAVLRILGQGAPPPLALPPANGVITGPPVHSPISGTWNVTSGSEAGFRVQEILFGQHHTAVGRTSAVSGGIVISGTTVNAADFTVDMQSVTTDAAGRNVAFHDFILKTGTYPHATLRLLDPISLGADPGEGKVVTEHAVGALTLRGVTRTVEFTVKAERLGSRVDVNAEIPIRYGLWHIPNPSFAIAHVGDTGTVEVLLRLERKTAGG